MVIFPLALDQTIAQMWSNGARGGEHIHGKLSKVQPVASHGPSAISPYLLYETEGKNFIIQFTQTSDSEYITKKYSIENAVFTKLVCIFEKNSKTLSLTL